jgi:hypothetical protein
MYDELIGFKELFTQYDNEANILEIDCKTIELESKIQSFKTEI